MNFATLPKREVQSVYDDVDNIDDVCEFQTSDFPKSDVRDSAEVLTSEKPTSGVLKNRGLDFRETRPLEVDKTEAKDNEFNYNNINNIYANDTNPILSHQEPGTVGKCDMIDEIRRCKEIISDNIDYETLKQNYGNDMADGVL